jgi:hypothetical protein
MIISIINGMLTSYGQKQDLVRAIDGLLAIHTHVKSEYSLAKIRTSFVRKSRESVPGLMHFMSLQRKTDYHSVSSSKTSNDVEEKSLAANNCNSLVMHEG